MIFFFVVAVDTVINTILLYTFGQAASAFAPVYRLGPIAINPFLASLSLVAGLIMLTIGLVKRRRKPAILGAEN